MKPSNGALLVVVGLVLLYLAVTGKLGAIWAAVSGASANPNATPAPGTSPAGAPVSGAAGGATGTGGDVLNAFPTGGAGAATFLGFPIRAGTPTPSYPNGAPGLSSSPTTAPGPSAGAVGMFSRNAPSAWANAGWTAY